MMCSLYLPLLFSSNLSRLQTQITISLFDCFTRGRQIKLSMYLQPCSQIQRFPNPFRSRYDKVSSAIILIHSLLALLLNAAIYRPRPSFFLNNLRYFLILFFRLVISRKISKDSRQFPNKSFCYPTRPFTIILPM